MSKMMKPLAEISAPSMSLLQVETTQFILDRFYSDTISKLNTLKKQQQQESLTSTLFLPPFMVALGSCAGAGKTTLSFNIGKALNNNENQKKSKEEHNEEEGKCYFANDEIQLGGCTIVPVDGYHLYRSELEKMENPEVAFEKRGAPFTFDSKKYSQHMEQLRKTGSLKAPAFSHSKKDPEEDAISIQAQTGFSSSSSHFSVNRKIVLVEGLYAIYDGGEDWKKALNNFDLLLYLQIDIDAATERLTKRHMRVWNQSREEAMKRAAGSDRDNGLLVIQSAERNIENIVLLKSIEDEKYACASQSASQ